MTVEKAAAQAFPGLTYDYALPHPFLVHCLDKGFDLRGQCVWVYDGNNIFGAPGPLTGAAVAYFEGAGVEFVPAKRLIDAPN
jgi:hypothetical protein